MLLFAITLFAASAAPHAAADIAVPNPVKQAARCPETPMSLARKRGKRPLQAIPLSKLPPAQTFMAVDRRIGGCPAPLTMIEYWNGGRR
jgi:hypothetical protein